MSITVSPSSSAPRSLAYRRACAQAFAGHICTARLRDGRPLTQLAPLAGLTVEEWEEIEAGRVPDTWEHVLLLAATLDIDRSWLPHFRAPLRGRPGALTRSGSGAPAGPWRPVLITG